MILRVALLDANVIASGLIRSRSPLSAPALIMERAYASEFLVVVSHEILDEVERTLTKRYFAERISEFEIETALGWLRRRAQIVTVTEPVFGIASHPEDDFVLAAALIAKCDYLVTGDTMLLRLEEYEGVKIISPRDFLTLLDATL